MTHECPGSACTEQVDASRLTGHDRAIIAKAREVAAGDLDAYRERYGDPDDEMARASALLEAKWLLAEQDAIIERRTAAPASSLKHPACGSAVGSQPQAGPFSSPQQGPGGPHR